MLSAQCQSEMREGLAELLIEITVIYMHIRKGKVLQITTSASYEVNFLLETSKLDPKVELSILRVRYISQADWFH